MDWSGVVAFTRTVQAGSLQQGARVLGSTPEEIQLRISGLESALGVSLLTEYHQQLVLTPIGQLAFVQFQALLEAAVQIEQSIIQQQSCISGPLNLTLPHLFGIHQLLPALPEFMRYYPDIELNLNFVAHKDPLPRHPSELCITTDPGEESAQIARKLLTSEYVLVASPNYLKTDNLPQRPRDLKNHQLIGLNLHDESDVQTWQLQGAQEKFVIRPYNLRLNDEEALLQSALDGLGIAMLEQKSVESYIRQGQLTPLLTDYQLPIESYYLVSQRSLRQPARYQAFIDFMQVTFSQPELPSDLKKLRTPGQE